MKNFFLTVAVLVLAFTSSFAQKIEKPTLTPTEPTAAQRQLINDGAKLHDQKLYAEAIANYDKVLQENPTCIMAIYEKTLSLYYRKDFNKALDLAYQGTKYKSGELPLFYGLIANIYDDQGNPQKAIELYKQGISVLEGGEEYKPYQSSLYYNLGITKFRQKEIKEAREHFKKSATLNFGYASQHYMLATIYKGTGYKIPALLAAARFISLEFNTQRTKNAVVVFKQIIGSGAAKSDNGNITIFMDPNAPKDEGDFTAFDLILGTLTAVKTDAGKNKSELDLFADAVDTIIVLLVGDKKLPATFVGKTYVPFMTQMKTRGYIKPFAAIVLHQGGDEKATAWLKENQTQALEFLDWAKSYR